MPFESGGRPHFLRYRGATGEILIDRLRSEARGLTTVPSRPWRPGWKIAFLPSSGLRLVSYRSASSEIDIDRIVTDASGRVTGTRFEKRVQATRDWTQLMPFAHGGKPHFLTYDAASGRYAIYDVATMGGGNRQPAQHLRSGILDRGWTHLTPFTLGGKPHFLAYFDGTYWVYRIGLGHQAVTRLRKDTYLLKGWTSFTTFEINGKVHIVSYMARSFFGNNNASYGQVTNNGRGSETVWVSRMIPGFSYQGSFETAGKPHLLSYSDKTGVARIHRISG